MLLRLDRLNTCLGLCLLRISLDSSTTVSPRSPEKGKRKRSATPAPAASPKQWFEFDDESITLPKGRGVYFEDPNFECALKTQEKTAASRRSGRIRRAAPVFQSSP